MERKPLMMDAGTALFESKGFGTAIGSVKTALMSKGKLLQEKPEDYDFLADLSTPWRKIHILCKVEDTGTGKFAAVFKQGDCNTALRTYVLALAAVLSAFSNTILGFFLPELSNAIIGTLGIILALLLVYSILSAGSKGVDAVKDIQRQLEGK